MEPGIYEDHPNAAYHAETDWLSSTLIKKHLPEKFKPSGNTSSKDFGSQLHNMILGTPEPFIVVDAATWTGKDAKARQEEAWAEGKLALLTKEIPVLHAMIDSVNQHDEASRLLFGLPGVNEVSVFTHDHRGIPMKARYDRVVDDGGRRIGVDLKSFTGQPGASSVAKAVIDWGYDVQEAHYEDVADAAGMPLDGFKFVFVSKEPPHYVMVADLDDEFRIRGRVLRDLGVDRMLNPEMVEPYEGAKGTISVRMPGWARL